MWTLSTAGVTNRYGSFQFQRSTVEGFFFTADVKKTQELDHILQTQVTTANLRYFNWSEGWAYKYPEGVHLGYALLI